MPGVLNFDFEILRYCIKTAFIPDLVLEVHVVYVVSFLFCQIKFFALRDCIYKCHELSV